MPLRKLPDSHDWTQQYCHHPEHNPPGHIVLQPGTYVHTCPGCGQTIVFTVPQGPTLRQIVG
jgi:hypothetical protein